MDSYISSFFVRITKHITTFFIALTCVLGVSLLFQPILLRWMALPNLFGCILASCISFNWFKEWVEIDDKIKRQAEMEEMDTEEFSMYIEFDSEEDLDYYMEDPERMNELVSKILEAAKLKGLDEGIEFIESEELESEDETEIVDDADYPDHEHIEIIDDADYPDYTTEDSQDEVSSNEDDDEFGL